MAEELADLLQELSTPHENRGKSKDGQVSDDYLRGKIRALNWALSLPNRFLLEYNHQETLRAQEEQKSSEQVLGRRISPTPDQEE
jgi:hypothetical protein